MASTSTFPSLVPRNKTPVIIVLAGSIVTLGPSWRNSISSYIDPLVERLSEECHPRPVSLRSLRSPLDSALGCS